jgi:hypothetical protein
MRMAFGAVALLLAAAIAVVVGARLWTGRRNGYSVVS